MKTANSLQAGMSNKCAILVVEDDEIIRTALCDILEAEGFDVTCCDNGFKAVDAARQGCFEVIITDHGLPGIDGAEIVRTLRSQCPATFIIGVSAGRKEKDFIEAGADIYLHKPYSFRELVDLARNYCRNRAQNSDHKEDFKESRRG